MNAKYEVTVDVSIVGATVGKQKHTEGPWQADAISGREYQIVVRAADGYPAAIAQGETHPEAQANAHLIAAAPDLLAAAIEAREEFLRSVPGSALDKLPAYQALDSAIAIAKAEGRPA